MNSHKIIKRIKALLKDKKYDEIGDLINEYMEEHHKNTLHKQLKREQRLKELEKLANKKCECDKLADCYGVMGYDDEFTYRCEDCCYHDFCSCVCLDARERLGRE